MGKLDMAARPQAPGNAIPTKLVGIKGKPGCSWGVVEVDARGRALAVRFNSERGGAARLQLRKRPEDRGDGAAPWLFRFWRDGREFWRSVSPAGVAPDSREGISRACLAALDLVAPGAAAGLPAGAASLAALAGQWTAAGMPGADGIPRGAGQQSRQRPFLARALRWWGPQVPAAVTPGLLADYHSRRTAASSRGCSRSVDLELVALSNLCAWAYSRGLATGNPFANRPRFRQAAAVTHSSERMPASDEDLHRIIGWLFTQSDRHIAAGAYLMFQALTGLRPGEPSALRIDARQLTHGAEPGFRWVSGAGQEFIAVKRSKSGVNPAVLVTPALAAFLGAWLPYRAARFPTAPWWFPDPEETAKPLVEFGNSQQSGALGRALTAACSATGLPLCSPHGMRAFFTRCCLSAGDDFGAVASKLGQRSGAAMVARAYSHLSNVIGDGRFDGLSDAGQAWEALLPAPR